MINATEAARLTAEKVQSMTAELQAKIQAVITSAIDQGSCKATFFPRTLFDAENEVEMLSDADSTAVLISAKDQRDNDRIEMSW